jgi:hypothetical protein
MGGKTQGPWGPVGVDRKEPLFWTSCRRSPVPGHRSVGRDLAVPPLTGQEIQARKTLHCTSIASPPPFPRGNGSGKHGNRSGTDHDSPAGIDEAMYSNASGAKVRCNHGLDRPGDLAGESPGLPGRISSYLPPQQQYFSETPIRPRKCPGLPFRPPPFRTFMQKCPYFMQVFPEKPDNPGFPQNGAICKAL